MTDIYTHADCGTDLIDDAGITLWCPTCLQTVSYAKAAGDT